MSNPDLFFGIIMACVLQGFPVDLTAHVDPQSQNEELVNSPGRVPAPDPRWDATGFRNCRRDLTAGICRDYAAYIHAVNRGEIRYRQPLLNFRVREVIIRDQINGKVRQFYHSFCHSVADSRLPSFATIVNFPDSI